MMEILGEAEVRERLPLERAVERMEAALVALHRGSVAVPERHHLPLGEGGTLLVMPASAADVGAVTKLVSVVPDNTRRGLPTVQGLVVVLDPRTGAARAGIDAAFFTAWRTAATAVAASRPLLPADLRSAALIGTGAQARTLAEALATCCNLAELRVWSPRSESRRRLADDVAPRVPRTTILLADRVEDAVRDARLVAVATRASRPVFDGRLLPPGSHVIGVGSYRPDLEELDDFVVRSSRIFVERRDSAVREGGELAAGVRRGSTDPRLWTEIGAVLGGSEAGRRSAQERTFFKSVGSAAEDLFAACAIFETAPRGSAEEANSP